jgi:hypothetical protein
MNVQADNSCISRSLSWGAVLTGALVALGLTFLFNLLTIALGLSLYTQSTDGAKVLTFAGYAWVLIGGYIILFISGWIAGRLVHHHCILHWCNGILHGFVTWTVYLILSMMVLSYMATPASVSLLRTTFMSITDESTTSINPDRQSDSKSTPQTVHKAGHVAFGSFFIFLVGALGCAAGAAYGVRERRLSIERKQGNVI